MPKGKQNPETIKKRQDLRGWLIGFTSKQAMEDLRHLRNALEHLGSRAIKQSCTQTIKVMEAIRRDKLSQVELDYETSIEEGTPEKEPKK